VNKTNLHSVSSNFQVMMHYWSDFCFQFGVHLFNALVFVIPMNITISYILPKAKVMGLYFFVEDAVVLTFHGHSISVLIECPCVTYISK